MTFHQKLEAIVSKNNSLVCVGLDSDINKIPEHIRNGQHPQSTFNRVIIDATHDLVCAYKPNTAFYEARGKAGIEALKMTCDYINEKYPDIPIILDAKRGDIGSTNDGYVSFAFDYLRVDAITVHPYFGKESLRPFLDRKDKGIIVLIRSSNPGAGEFQDLICGHEPLYLTIAKKVINEWNTNGNCLLMVGATYPEELAKVRRLAPDMTFLVPGIGAQGGDVEKTVTAGLDSQKTGLILNSSRAILFASTNHDFAESARHETLKLKNETNKHRNP